MEVNPGYCLISADPIRNICFVKYSKTACGVDFMLNTADSNEKECWFDIASSYKTDFFEFYFFRKASGWMSLNGDRIELCDDTVLIIPPFTCQEWHVNKEGLDYVFLIFHDEFIYNFTSDKFFMYRLLYCYQNDNPSNFHMCGEHMNPFLKLLVKMKNELHHPVADSYHLIVAYLFEFLLMLNRYYADLFNLPLRLPLNNYAFNYKMLLEKNIRRVNKVGDYASMMGISRIVLNKAVENEFGVTAVHLLKQRLLQEVKNELLFSNQSIKEISYSLNFSAPNHLMRFFKKQTGLTITDFLADIRTHGLS